MSDRSESDSGDERAESGGPLAKVQNACAMMCLGMFFFPCALFLLGWNEKETVCTERRLLYAEDNAKSLACEADVSAEQGNLVFFSCPINQDALTPITPAAFGTTGLASAISIKSPAVTQIAEMFQCVQHKWENKDSDGKVLGRKYKYEMAWKSDHIPSTAFKKSEEYIRSHGCPDYRRAVGNPAFPAGLNFGEHTTHAQQVKAGNFRVDEGLCKGFTADALVDLSGSTWSNTWPSFPGSTAGTWPTTAVVTPSTMGVMESDHFSLRSCKDDRLGCVKIQYKQSAATHATVIAHLASAGLTQPQPFEASWGCGDTEWSSMKPKPMTMDEMLAELKSENAAKTWLLRIGGLLGAWVAVFCCLQPIAAAADLMGDCLSCIPCVGGFLEDLLEGVVTCVLCVMSCNCGCACGLIVIAIVWIFMRPLYGICLLIGALVLIGIAIFIRMKMPPPKKKVALIDEEHGETEQVNVDAEG